MLQFFHGPDIYRLRQAINVRLAEKPDAAVRRLDMSEDDPAELERELKYPSFFQEDRFVVAMNALADAETAGAISELLAHYRPDKETTLTLIIAAQPGRQSAAGKELTAFLSRHADCFEFNILSGAERNAWIGQFCATRGCTMTPAGLTAFNGRGERDSWSLAMELEKLCAYCRGPIKAEDVQVLVGEIQEQNEFELSDALYANDKRGAVAALWRRLSEGTPEQLLLGALASATRTLISAKSLAGRGMAAAELARAVGMHPFVAQKALRGSARYTEQQLIALHVSLAELDRAGKDGRVDMLDGLVQAVLSI